MFVQANFGDWRNLTIRGVRAAPDLPMPAVVQNTPRAEKSSIIGVAATDAPLLPHQLKRIARRMPLGVALTGGYGYHSSGDIFLAFSTANTQAARAEPGKLAAASFIPDTEIDRFFDAVDPGDRRGDPQRADCQRGHDRPRRQFRAGAAEGVAGGEVFTG